jgi:hypothetical protein
MPGTVSTALALLQTITLSSAAKADFTSTP